jgi:hypothetical protein
LPIPILVDFLIGGNETFQARENVNLAGRSWMEFALEQDSESRKQASS